MAGEVSLFALRGARVWQGEFGVAEVACVEDGAGEWEVLS